jgi:hypothetical protein
MSRSRDDFIAMGSIIKSMSSQGDNSQEDVVRARDYDCPAGGFPVFPEDIYRLGYLVGRTLGEGCPAKPRYRDGVDLFFR